MILTADQLPVDHLEELTTANIAKQGRADYAAGLVKVDQTTLQGAWLTVTDHARPYQSYRVSVGQFGPSLVANCTCRQGYAPDLCRHRVAGFLKLHEYLTANPPSIWKSILDPVVRTPTQPRRRTASHGPIIFSIQIQRTDAWQIVPMSFSSAQITAELHADQELLQQLISKGRLEGTPRPIRSRVSAETHPDASEAAIAVTNLINSGGSGSYTYYTYGDTLYPLVLPRLAECLVFSGDTQHPVKRPVRVRSTQARLVADVEQSNGGLIVSAQLLVDDERIPLRGKVRPLTSNPPWVMVGDQIVHFEENNTAIQTLLANPAIEIPARDQAEFLDRYLLPLADRVDVEGSALAVETVTLPPEPRLYLSEGREGLEAALRFGYGTHELTYDKTLPNQSTRRKPGELALARIARDPAAEEQAFTELSSFGLKRSTTEPGTALLRKNTHPIDFLLKQVPKLAEAGYSVYGEENLKSARVNRNAPRINFKVKSGIDWFDVAAAVSFGEVNVPLKEIRQAIRQKARFIKLADGTIGALPQEWVDRYKHLWGLGEEHGEELRFNRAHVTLLDQLLTDADTAEIDPQFEQRRERLRGFERIESQPLPPGFTGTLRPYQKFGYDWLHFLRDYNFGGILADDMGLGKCVQTLAFLESLYHAEPELPATLIVMPRSLLFNWQREAEKFTPELAVIVHADAGRTSVAEEFAKQDVVLTTYGTMLRDIELLRSYEFHYVILDESQAIKNPVAETSKAARGLRAEHRLALTGTPVENNTLELWSQFAFLNPGLLGNVDYFRAEFAARIERAQDGETADLLRKMVFPFILRRTKEQVAQDLPERTEEIVICEMTASQRAAYVDRRDAYRNQLLGLVDQSGMQGARMAILEALLRLRQIANHPALADPEYTEGSGKFEQLLEQLDTLREEGHRALVFSQFVQMLSLVRKALDARGVRYAYLDGSTNKRQDVVDSFQNGTDPFFLISLKAGGVGLNLTAADYVIHIDPWWNPAVEQQATDRAHRIGQTKPVFVTRLVTRETVEEKVLLLQEQKRALVAQLVGAEGGVFKNLTRDDIEVLLT